MGESLLDRGSAPLVPKARVLLALGKRLDSGSLAVTLPNGQRHRFLGDLPGPEAELVITDWRALKRLLLGGAEGFAEGYLAGEWETPDLRRLMALGARNLEAWERALVGRPLYRAAQRLLHLLHRNSPRGAKRNIAYHYDLGNAFYRTWLDRSMTYSAAVFAGPDATLEAAQREKYRRIAALAEIRPDHRVLEIGCGWGGFAEFAAREIGARVTAITISDEQYDFARRRIQEAGLAERVEIRRQDYREVEGAFDRIASIEMLEAVGESHWPHYFARLRQNLKEGGRAALQVITIADRRFAQYRRGVDFIQRHIFPGGMLPSATVLRQHTAGAGLQWLGAASHGRDYARTLAEWRARFEAAWPEIAPLGFDERFRRMWTYYLAYCEAGFECGRLDVLHVALSRP